MNYTNEQLKAALAKMLPDIIYFDGNYLVDNLAGIYFDTELLHLCWLVEKSLCEYSGEHGGEYSQRDNYAKELMKLNGIYKGNGWSWGDICNADLFQAANSTWQQRVIALAKVKGIEI